MAKLTYAQIKDLQTQYGQEAMPVDQFAQMLARTDTANDYSAGIGTGIGSWLHKLNYGVNSVIDYTGLPQAASDLMGAVAGEAGREFGHMAPRMAVDMALSAIPGVGPALMAASMGVNTYGQTDSPLAGTLAGGLGLALGPVSRGAGQKAAELSGRVLGTNLTRVGENAANVVTPGMLKAMGVLAPEAASSAGAKGLAQQFVGQGARVAQAVGEQAGMLAGNVGIASTVSAAAAPSGQGFDAAMSTLTNPLTWATSALGQVIPGLMHARRTIAEPQIVQEVNKYGATYQKYYNDTMLPKEIRTELANEVNKRMLALPEVSENASRFRFEQRAAERVEARRIQAEQDLKRAGTLGLPEVGKANRLSDNSPTTQTLEEYTLERNKADMAWSTQIQPRLTANRERNVANMREVGVFEEGLGNKQLPWTEEQMQSEADYQAEVNAKGENVVTDLDPAAQVEVVNNADPAVSLKAANAITDTPDTVVLDEVADRVAAGESQADATETVLAKQKGKAKNKVAKSAVKKEMAGQAVPPGTVPPPSTPSAEVKASVREAANKQFLESAKEKRNAEKRTWWERYSDVTAKRNIQARDAMAKALTLLSKDAPETAFLSMIDKVQTWAKDTSAPIEELSKSLHEYAAKFREGGGKIKGTKAEQATLDLASAAISSAKAKTSAQKNAVRAITDVETFLGTVSEEQLTKAGVATARDRQRLTAALSEYQRLAAKEPGVTYDTLIESVAKHKAGNKKLFKDNEDVNEFLMDVSEVTNQYVKGIVKKFTGLSEASMAGEPASAGWAGQRVTLQELLRENGLAEPEHLTEASRLLTLFDNHDIGFARLNDRAGQAELGLFTQQTDGQKLVWLSQQADPKRAMFVLSHELNGHGLFELYRTGRLDPMSSKRIENFSNFVAEASPEQISIMMKEAWRMLPPKLRKDAGLQRMVEATNNEPEEVLANLNSIMSLAMVHSSTSAWGKFNTWMPKPLTDFVSVAFKYGKKMTDAINGMLFGRRLGTSVMESETEVQLNKYTETLNELLKVDEARAQQLADATRLGMTTDIGYFGAALGDKTLFIDKTLHPTTQQIVKAFGMVNLAADATRTVGKKISRGYDYWLQPLKRVAKMFPEFERVASESERQNARTGTYISRAMKHLAMVYDGVQWKVSKDAAPIVVGKHPVMSLVRDNLIRRANVLGKTVQENIVARDGDTMRELSRLPVEQQIKVREAIISHENAHKAANEHYLEMELEKLRYVTGTTMMMMDGALSSAAAEGDAAALISAMRAPGGYRRTRTFASKEAEEAYARAETFVSESLRRITDKYEFFKAHPEYVSEQRYGQYQIRWKYLDKSRKDGLVSAKTYQEMVSILRDLEAGKAAQGIDEIIAKGVEPKKNYDYRADALEKFAAAENKANADAARLLESLGISRADAESILEANSAVADMQREIAMSQLPARTVARRHADGREMLDMMSQQIDSIELVTRGLSKSVSNAKMKMLLKDPKLREHEMKDYFVQAWEQFRKPDPASVRKIQSFAYYSYLSMNLVNMIQDTFMPLFSSLPADLISDSKMGVVETYSRVAKQMRRMGTYNMTGKGLRADEVSMLQKFREGNRGIGTYSDETNNPLMEAIDLRRVATGHDPLHKGHYLTSKLSSLLLMNKKFHKKFTDYGVETALLASYEHMRSKGMSIPDAQEAAFDFAITATGAWNKGGRAVGIWSADKLRPLSGAMTSLQTFAFNQIGSLKNYAEMTLNAEKNLSTSQRKQALKAFGVQTAMMTAQAGLYGLPFVGAALALVDKMFGINSKEEIASMLSEVEHGKDYQAKQDGTEYGLSQIATHGLFNMLGGDYASRSSVSGVMGINAYDGFNLETLAGPTYSLVKKVFQGINDTVSGEDSSAAVTSVLPSQMQKIIKLAKDDFEWRRPDGSLIGTATPVEKVFGGVFGIRPTRVANVLERDMWQRRDAEIESAERSKWIDGTVELIESGRPQVAREDLKNRIASRPTENASAVANAVATRFVERLAGKDPRRAPGYSERLGRTTGALGTELNETQRLMLVSKVMEQLGYGVSRERWKNAAIIDSQRAATNRPWLPASESRMPY